MAQTIVEVVTNDKSKFSSKNNSSIWTSVAFVTILEIFRGLIFISTIFINVIDFIEQDDAGR